MALGLLLVILLLAGCGAPPGPKSVEPAVRATSPTSMSIASASFTPGQPIPKRFSSYGENISPELHWENVPAGTKSLAIVCRDPDAPGRTFTHWIIFNIPPDLQRLEEGVSGSARLLSGIVEGQNDFGRVGYGGPRPPAGTHRYYFDIYALDTKLELGQSATAGQLMQAMAGHILGQASVMGTYRR